MSSCMPLPKKLHHLLPSSTTKAWTSFTSSLHHPKLRRLGHHLKNLPKSLTTTARRHLRPKRPRQSAFIPRKPHTSGARLSYYKYQYQHLQQPYSGGPNSPAATVYVDRLFGDDNHQPSTSSSSQAETGAAVGAAAVSGGGGGGGERRRRRRKKLEVEEGRSSNNNNNNNNNNNGVKWKEYVSALPAIRGVDERAEEFISKFRHQMELQREQSLIDFHQMLARST